MLQLKFVAAGVGARTHEADRPLLSSVDLERGGKVEIVADLVFDRLHDAQEVRVGIDAGRVGHVGATRQGAEPSAV